MNNVWVKASERLPEVVDGKCHPRFVRIERVGHSGKVFVVKAVAYYFPEHFKSVEWEDWDDYSEEDFPYTESDEQRGVVWLRPGWYADIECDACDNSHWSAPLNVIEWLDESGPSDNKEAIENEQEQKKAKAWDDWKDSLVTHENVFVHYKKKDEHYTEDFTLEEFKKVMTEKSPVFIYCNEWSSKIPHFQITTRVMPSSGFYYFCNAWADKTPVHTTIEEFYKKLQQPGLKYFSF